MKLKYYEQIPFQCYNVDQPLTTTVSFNSLSVGPNVVLTLIHNTLGPAYNEYKDAKETVCYK